MSYALPHPRRSLAVPLATLALGAAGGASLAAVLNDDTIVFRSPAPAAEISTPSVSAPVPERVSPTPGSITLHRSGTAVPVPERVAPDPKTSSLAGTTSDTPAPVPERISGARP